MDISTSPARRGSSRPGNCPSNCGEAAVRPVPGGRKWFGIRKTRDESSAIFAFLPSLLKALRKYYACVKICWTWVLCLAALLFPFLSEAQALPLQRVANTSLHFPTAPPTYGFTYTNAFPGLAFANPVCIVSPPGETNRLFIVEKTGRIDVITNLANPTKTLFMDISSYTLNAGETAWADERGLLGLAFHPGYLTNRFFYVFYTGYDVTP